MNDLSSPVSYRRWAIVPLWNIPWDGTESYSGNLLAVWSDGKRQKTQVCKTPKEAHAFLALMDETEGW